MLFNWAQGYGRYAALMGPIRHPGPGVYQCAVSLAGVTDIDLMYDIGWSDLSESWKRYGMPLLLAHGGQDVRVPVDHSIKFRAAAEKNGVQVEWVGYSREQHGLFREDNDADFPQRVEAFLACVLTPSSQPAGRDSAP